MSRVIGDISSIYTQYDHTNQKLVWVDNLYIIIALCIS